MIEGAAYESDSNDPRLRVHGACGVCSIWVPVRVFYELGLWPLGAITRIMSAVALIAVVLVGIPFILYTLYTVIRNKETVD